MEDGFGGPTLRHSGRARSKGWTGEMQLRGLASRFLVGGGEIKLSLSQCGFQESLVEEKLAVLRAIPGVIFFLTIWAARTSGYDWWA